MKLKERFNKLAESLDFTQDWQNEKWEEIFENYSESYRTYHNMTHLDELFRWYDLYEKELKFPEEVNLAIFYHDIIYTIGDSKNEEKSALVAQEALRKMNFPKEKIERIVAIIKSTKTHEANTEDEAWMIDFDLSILGQSWEIYQSYSKKIREEYKKIPSLLYRKGRKKVLKHFLDKDSIFKTKIFIDMFEEKTRENLKKELQNL